MNYIVKRWGIFERMLTRKKVDKMLTRKKGDKTYIAWRNVEL